jgi:hypothetical protein
MGDAATHLTRADYTNRLDCHRSNSFILPKGACRAFLFAASAKLRFELQKAHPADDRLSA